MHPPPLHRFHRPTLELFRHYIMKPHPSLHRMPRGTLAHFRHYSVHAPPPHFIVSTDIY